MRQRHLRWAAVAALTLSVACSTSESSEAPIDEIEVEASESPATTDPPDTSTTTDPSVETTTTTAAPETTTTTAAPETTTTEAASETTTTTDTATTTTTAPVATTGAPADDGGDDAIATAGLAAAFDTLVGSLDLADDATVDFARCPLDPDDEIIVSIFGDPALGLDDRFVAPARDAGAFVVGGGYGPMVFCDLFPDESFDGVGLFAINTPDDVAAYTTAFVNPDGRASITSDITPRGDVRGGVLTRVCVADAEEPELDYCELQWAADGVSLGAYVNGALTTVDLEAFERSFVAQLDRLVAALAGP